jgi:HEPN domain-containing protein
MKNMEKNLQYQQSQVWDFYKSWVSNHYTHPTEEREMYLLCEKLNALLIAEENRLQKATYHPSALMKFAEKDYSAVIRFIADVVGPEKIFCLSHQIGADGLDYADLLIIIPEVHPQTFPEIEQTLNFACLKHHHLSCSLLKASFFNRMIRKGQIYYAAACNKESLIYDGSGNRLPLLKPELQEERKKKANREFYNGLIKAKAFYSTAETHRTSNPDIAAFNLQQAAELCLRSLMKALTGQDKSTHCLKTLLKFTLRLNSKLSALMSDGSADDELLLQVLQNAYIGSRYTLNYTITDDDLKQLFWRIKKLHEYAEEVFLDWMEKFDELFTAANRFAEPDRLQIN